MEWIELTWSIAWPILGGLIYFGIGAGIVLTTAMGSPVPRTGNVHNILIFLFWPLLLIAELFSLWRDK